MANIVSDADASTFLGIAPGDPLMALVHRGVEKDVIQFLGWNPARGTYTRYLPKSEGGGRDDYFVGAYGVIPRAGGATELLALEHKYVLNSGIEVQEGPDGNFGQRSDAVWTNLTKGTHFILQIDEEEGVNGGLVSRSGTLVRIGTEWPKSRGSVKATYTAGFTVTELDGTLSGASDYTDASDLRLAVLQALGRAYNQAKMHQAQASGRSGGLATSESIDGYSYSLDGSTAQMNLGLVQPLPLEVQLRLQRYRRYGGLLL